MGNAPCCTAGKDLDPSEVLGVKTKSPIIGDDLGLPEPGADGQIGAAALLKGQGGAQTLKYQDGSSYVGQIVNQMRDGHGKFTAADGSECYEGQWCADAQHGHGRLLWSDGRSYEGQFANGRFNGKAKMMWKSDAGIQSYDGEYQDDLKHGQGKFVWPDGRIYEGGWYKGKRHGKASYTANGKIVEEAWEEDKCVRRDGKVLA